MTLNKQLWAIVSAVVLIMFVCGVLITTASNVQQVSQQLSIKNNDNANLLAQMLSEMDKDEVFLELILAAQFDTGYYEYLSLKDTSGETIISREFAGDVATNVPNWFLRLIQIDASPGVALVSDGWNQFGSIEVRSHSGYLINDMWSATKRFGFWSAIIAILVGAIGTAIQRKVTRPLDRVVEQAEALGDKRYISLPVPGTLEYKKLVLAMNKLTARVKDIIDKNNDKISQLRDQTERDELTGLANRQVFMQRIDALLTDIDEAASHGLVMLRLRDLDKLNRTLGRRSVDEFLVNLSRELDAYCQQQHSSMQEALVARLNGSDFAILLEQPTHTEEFAERLQSHVARVLERFDQANDSVLIGSTNFNTKDSKSQAMMRLDSALSQLESTETHRAFLHIEGSIDIPYATADEWRKALLDAIASNQVFFEFYPVVHTASAAVIHYEGMIRARLNSDIRHAGYFLPWARRLELIDQIELAALRQLFSREQTTTDNVAIKLSFDFISHQANRHALVELIQSHPTKKVTLEFHEAALMGHAVAFEVYCKELRQAGFKVGIQGALNCFNQLSNIHEFGLDEIKLHASLTQSAHDSEAGKSMLAAFCSLGHSIGATVIAQGFSAHHNAKLLAELGVDGVTGPGVSLSE